MCVLVEQSYFSWLLQHLDQIREAFQRELTLHRGTGQRGMQSNSQATDFYACAGPPLALHSILVVEGILAVVGIPVVADDNLVALGIPAVEGILEAASAVLHILGVAAQVGPHVPQALLLAALQVVVLLLAVPEVALLVVRMVVPGYS
jgi:hypothetical protein